MAAVPPPPRQTGDFQADYKAYIEWFIEVYEIGFVGNQFWKEDGTFTINEANTTAEVVFDNAQTDTDYIVFTISQAVSGAVADGSSTVKSITKTTTGFTVAVETAPGAGTAVLFDWALMRRIV
jgi:hypothetical protein